MKIPNRDLSTAELAAQTRMKLTEIRRAFVPLQGNVYVCRLDGKAMRITEARRIIESRLGDIERAQRR